RAVRSRPPREEAKQAVAQLPHELKGLWSAGSPPARQPVKLRRREFLERVRLDGGLKALTPAEMGTGAVFAGLKEQLSRGEADDIVAQLPRDLKTLWVRA